MNVSLKKGKEFEAADLYKLYSSLTQRKQEMKEKNGIYFFCNFYGD